MSAPSAAGTASASALGSGVGSAGAVCSCELCSLAPPSCPSCSSSFSAAAGASSAASGAAAASSSLVVFAGLCSTSARAIANRTIVVQLNSAALLLSRVRGPDSGAAGDRGAGSRGAYVIRSMWYSTPALQNIALHNVPDIGNAVLKNRAIENVRIMQKLCSLQFAAVRAQP